MTPIEQQKLSDALVARLKQRENLQTEITRLEGLARTLPDERERLLATGAHDDESIVAAAATVNTKLAMIPHKLRQLRELLANADRELLPLINPLTDALHRELESLRSGAVTGINASVMDTLAKFLPAAPDVVAYLALWAAWNCLPVVTLSLLFVRDEETPHLQLIVGHPELNAFQRCLQWNEFSPPVKGRELLLKFKALAQVREKFFKGGDDLDLDAIAKYEGFKFPTA